MDNPDEVFEVVNEDDVVQQLTWATASKDQKRAAFNVDWTVEQIGQKGWWKEGQLI